MSLILRFLIPILFSAVAFGCAAEKVDYTYSENISQSLSSNLEVEYLGSSVEECDCFLPIQTVGVNLFRPQPTAKRTSNTHKNQYEFVRYGKVINIAGKYFKRTHHFKILNAFIKPGHRLISLGKLII